MRKLHFQADLRRLFLDWFTKKITVTCSFEEETEISRCREKSWKLHFKVDLRRNSFSGSIEEDYFEEKIIFFSCFEERIIFLGSFQKEIKF